MLLYSVRHGDPDYVNDCLTEKGILQAEAVGKRIAASGINEIYSSPMGRAQQTAAPACRLLGLPCNIEPWAHEVEEERLSNEPYGKPTSVSLIQNTYFLENGGIDLPYDRSFEALGFRSSGMKEAQARIIAGGRDFLERLGYKEEEGGIYRILRPNEDKVALFCHRVQSCAWLSHLLHIPIHIMWSSLHLTHTGVTVVEFRNWENGITAPLCLCHSDMGHLYAEGLPMRYDRRIDL
jgi:probable phosphoglycerate mutase